MKFRTTIKPLEKRGMITHKDGIMMLGSCFSDNIGAKLKECLFNVDINPFGTTYNPESISLILDKIIDLKRIEENELFYYHGIWNNFYFHSKYSGTDKDKVLYTMNEQLEKAHNRLKEARILFITLGTAFKYTFIESGKTVNNCHKLPNVQFSRTLLKVDEISGLINNIILRLKEFNSQIKIIFTISPIRHIADGLSENQLSKSTLRVALRDIIEKSIENCSYFPAFEIMMDDLRDYRFYAADMVHPSEVAIEYIWDIFQASYCDDATQEAAMKCQKLNRRLNHRLMTDNMEAINKFNEATKEASEELILEFPYLKDRI